MKTQKDNNDLVIIYDADCPMCRWYTGKFVQYNFLTPNGIEPYQQIGPFTKTQIDMQKARNHIALLNKKTGEVTYGVNSILTILGQRWKWIKTAANTKLIAPLLSVIYDFISFNRKIIAPAPRRSYLDCAPDLNLGYRLAFVFCAMLLVEFTAGAFFKQWFPTYTRYNTIHWRESILFISQIVFQGLFAILLKEKQKIEYISHVAVVAAYGGLLLVPMHFFLLGMAHFGLQTAFLAPAILGAVLMAMFMEHKRRINLMGYKPMLSYTWVLFRVVLFFLLFNSK